ncbi:MAG: aminodeoxychorismate synthase component I [Lonepinella koalarum]|nr:aminodeoxychorismate synthase component I [Lonepinella koalarum]
MNFKHFIQQANQYGKKRQAFFFVIDFEQQKPLIFTLEETKKCGVFFNILGHSNREKRTDFSAEPLNLLKMPLNLAEYKKGFSLVQNELQKGNSYLLNLTYPTEISINLSLEQIFYQSQAKYKLWVKDQFVCFSPECFVRTENNQIYTYPMKGTIDATLPDAEQLLLNNEKEKQEHYTIVDLMRNDLAIVAKNIRVKHFRYVDKIMTERGAILQTSSEIVGDLSENWRENIGSILANLLPAGSISGAPKEKTVEIIQQAELGKRGYYTGVFGLFDGENMHSAVAIRFIEQQSERYYFRSGGGITRHSILEDEYAELLQKVYIPLNKQDKSAVKK